MQITIFNIVSPNLCAGSNVEGEVGILALGAVSIREHLMIKIKIFYIIKNT